MPTKSKKTQYPHKVLVDKIFQVPDSARQAFTTDPSQTGGKPVSTYVSSSYYTSAANLAAATYNSVFALMAPSVFTIVDQKLRRAPGGQQVVDVVVDITDVIGAMNYEMQIVKA